MARALGAVVQPMGVKEIGFAPIKLTEAGRASVLATLSPDLAVLHWHGDQFNIPPGADRLAYTDTCPNQAFTVGNHALALQFHLELNTDRIEQWLVGHAAELMHANINPCVLRTQAGQYSVKLKLAAEKMLNAWLDGVGKHP